MDTKKKLKCIYCGKEVTKWNLFCGWFWKLPLRMNEFSKIWEYCCSYNCYRNQLDKLVEKLFHFEKNTKHGTDNIKVTEILLICGAACVGVPFAILVSLFLVMMWVVSRIILVLSLKHIKLNIATDRLEDKIFNWWKYGKIEA